MAQGATTVSDSAEVEAKNIAPAPGLGAHFEKAPFPHLTLSTKSRVWGDETSDAIEPTAADFQVLRQKALARDGYRCMYCGFHSDRNEVHNVNDNHQDSGEDNLRAADPLCHGWSHLGEVGDENAVIAYLPALSAQDANHLQRTLMMALNADDPAVRRDAKALLNWMASHRDYVKNAWGGSQPSVFAAALVRGEADLDKKAVVFEDLAVVFNPAHYRSCAVTWMQEISGAFPVSEWGRVYHNVMHAPA